MAYPGRRTHTRSAAVATVALSAIVFWLTAYPTITWWDSSSYSLAAATLGVNSPPGSLLLTLLGWPVAHLGFGMSPARALNVFAGVIAALTAALVCVNAIRLLRMSAEPTANAIRDDDPAAAIGVVLGALTFAFTATTWEYAVKFTPYILSAAFTGLILWTLLRWWDAAEDVDGWRWLALLGLLFGLDFSVHRTNALLIPGAVIWILIRSPRTMVDARASVASVGGLVAGLAIHFLLIPIAAFTQSSLNFSDPSNLSRFWDYVTIKQLGGSFLLNLIPRKSPLFSAQTMDLLRVLADNFLHASGRAGLLGILPAIAALTGVAVLWRRNSRLAIAFVVLLVVQAGFTVFYFNIPANYFRTFERHYLPVCVTIAVLMAYGTGATAARAGALLREQRRLARAATAAVLCVVPVTQLVNNWAAKDASQRHFTGDYAANALLTLPRDAIYFTVGDNDTFPVMYLQSVEGVRPDVTIINLSVANIPAWPDQLRRRDPRLPISLALDQRSALGKREWTDTSVVIPVVGPPETFALPTGTTLPASITLDVRPISGSRMLPAEVVLLDIIRTNAWKRPLTFAVTGGQSAMEWVAPYGRLEGLYYRVVPVRYPPVDVALLRRNLLEIAQYRGYADPAIPIDDATRMLGLQPYGGFVALLEAERAHGSLEQCRADKRAMLAKLPPARLGPPQQIRAGIESACGD